MNVDNATTSEPVEEGFMDDDDNSDEPVALDNSAIRIGRPGRKQNIYVSHPLSAGGNNEDIPMAPPGIYLYNSNLFLILKYYRS